VIEHAVMHGAEVVDALGRTDWAEWLPNGDLVFTRGGELLRLLFDGEEIPMSDCAETVADFSGLRFEPKEAPKKAQRW